MPRADVFYRKFNSRRPSRGEVMVEVPMDAGLVAIIEAAGRACGKALERRSSTIGVYEVQTHAGIWSATDGRALTRYTRGTCVVRPQARFKTWDQLEAEDEAEASLRELEAEVAALPPGPARDVLLYLFAAQRPRLIARMQKALARWTEGTAAAPRVE